SHGTAKTMVEALGLPSAVRRNGRITPVPVGYKTRQIPFTAERDWFAMTIPWGDVSTAYYTTGIPNIETYTGISPKTYRWVKWQRYLAWFLRLSWVKAFLKRRIESGPAGPSDEQRERSQSLVWGQVTDEEGHAHTARLTTLEGYTLTAMTSLMITKKVLEGEVFPGHQTPAGAYGADLVMELPSTKREDL
ncbi:MAG: hypothetical protein KDC54_12300, partial [Lewinella sp.]|nr:hypothetical protein [Lewinella sp.]